MGLASERFGAVDTWINNAALARTMWPIPELPQDEVETMIATNMLGTINGSRAAARGMVARGHGKLFNMLGAAAMASTSRHGHIRARPNAD